MIVLLEYYDTVKQKSITYWLQSSHMWFCMILLTMMQKQWTFEELSAVTLL